MAEEKKDSFWKRISRKYRLSVMHEDTLAESWHVRLSWLGALTITTLMFLLTVGLLSALIIYTPIRHILPGYSEDLRQQLVSATERMDSLQNEMALQHNYLDLIKLIMSGEVATDTIQPLDSIEVVMREQLLEAKNEATQEFMAQYEEKEKNSFQLFDIQQNTPVYTLFRPASGVVVRHYNPQSGDFGIDIKTPDNENITAVLAGVVVYVNYEIDNTYTLMLQHSSYISVYRHAGRVMKKTGDAVKAGESIALASKEFPLSFELWQNGKNINPEEVIVF